MGYLVPRNNDIILGNHETYEIDLYVKEYGDHGYLKRYVVEDGNKILGCEYLEIKQLNFSNPATIPGPLCRMKTLPGRLPYLTAICQHPHVLYLAQHNLSYDVPIKNYWIRHKRKDIPDLSIIYGNSSIGFHSPEEVDLEEN